MSHQPIGNHGLRIFWYGQISPWASPSRLSDVRMALLSFLLVDTIASVLRCDRSSCFVNLTFNFKVTGGLLKVQFGPIFLHFGPVLIFRKLDHPMAGVYNIYMSSVSMQKFDLEDLHWRSDRQSISPRPFLAFLKIFSHLMLTILRGNYWKWLWRLSTWWSTSIQFVDLGYYFQGHLRPAKMTQNGTLDCEAIYLLYYWLLPL